MKNKTAILSLALISIIAITNTALASGIINHDNCDQVIDKVFYKICYSYKYKGALFVEYDLDKKVNDVNIKKRPRFYIEKRIPKKYRTKYSDYTKNEWHADRGHLAPDASFDWSQKSLDSVYSMANIIPQYNKINRKTWLKAEKYERLVAARSGKAHVLNGVIYGDLKMAKSGIGYPEAFYKIGLFAF